jgi:lysophospholipase L1-like esterase
VAAVISLLVLCGLVSWIPGLEGIRPWARHEAQAAAPDVQLDPEQQRIGEAEISLATEQRSDLAQPENVTLPNDPAGPIAEARIEEPLPRVDAEKPPVPIVDGENGLDRFFTALALTARKRAGAITRITYFGDSIVASDFTTGTLRRKLQEQFGDSGHGFVLIANAWPAYFHNDVYRLASRGWKVSRIVGPYVADGLYGLGGVSFNAPPGLRSRVGTNAEGHFGTRMSRAELWYLEQPGGGRLTLNVDGQEQAVIDTSGEHKRGRRKVVTMPDGPHRVELVTGRGATRTFGFVLERDEPGVVLDAIGVVGARIRFLDKQDDAHWAEQLAMRSPNLVVFQFGANESGDGFAYPMADYHRTMRDVLVQAQKAVPDAGCLIVGALDRARKEDTGLVTVPIIPHIVEVQRKVARELGCAFFDSFAAMGGKGSMAKWVRRGLGAGDLMHPTSVGAEVLGNWIYRGLMERFDDFTAEGASDQGTPSTPR